MKVFVLYETDYEGFIVHGIFTSFMLADDALKSLGNGLSIKEVMLDEYHDSTMGILG